MEVTPWDGNYPIWDEGLTKFCKMGEHKSDYFHYKRLSDNYDTKNYGDIWKGS